MTIKELFDKAENNTLTLEQFEAAMGDAKFVDLTEGNYVSKQKFNKEITQRDNRIKELDETIATRDEDLSKLQQTLQDAGDLEALKKASTDLQELQQKYEAETQAYQKQLTAQAYEFAVKEYANSKNFTSNAAKRDFIQSMIAKNLMMEDGKIIGADDFVTIYSKDNADAFAKKEEPNQPKFSAGTQNKNPAKPTLSELMRMKNENPDAVLNF